MIKARAQEKTAKIIIYIITVLTVLILLWIIGYIFYRGFYKNTVNVSQVIPAEENVIFFPDTKDDGLIVIVNKSVRVKYLNIYDLNTIYNKERRENWGFYSEQNLKVQPFFYKPPESDTKLLEFTENAAGLLLLKNKKYKKYISFVKTPAEMIDMVIKTPGAIGFVPSELSGNLKDVKQIPVRRICVAVNPGVMEMENNRKIQTVTKEDLVNIFTGKIKNWKEIRGRDLEITPVILQSESGEKNIITEYLIKSDYNSPPAALIEKSFYDFNKVISAKKGAIGLCFYPDAIKSNFALIDVESREKGVNLTLSFLLETPAHSGQWGGILPVIINTILLIIFTLLVSTPIGIGAAVFLVEYAKQGRLVSILRMGTETLAGIPSIIFGLFGHIFFVQVLNLGIGFLSGTLTVTIMILPTIIRTTEESLKSVPVTYKEGSLALGATKLQTIFKVIVPAASPGILTGIILAIGRTAGETAVLLYTLGSSYGLVRSLTSSARVLSLHLYLLFSEAVSFEKAFATGAVLIILILIVNFTLTSLVGKMNRSAGY